LALVAADFVGVIDAVESEFPGVAGAEQRVLDGDTVTDFPAETLGCFCSGDGSGAIFDEIVPLIVGNAEFGKNLALIFDVNGELREEILLMLVDAAESVVVGEGLDARNAQDLVLVGNRQRLNDGNAVDDHQAVGTGDVRAAAEGALNDGKEGEQEQGNCERADGENEPYFFAKEIGENQAAEFHATPPASAPWRN